MAGGWNIEAKLKHLWDGLQALNSWRNGAADNKYIQKCRPGKPTLNQCDGNTHILNISLQEDQIIDNVQILKEDLN